MHFIFLRTNYFVYGKENETVMNVKYGNATTVWFGLFNFTVHNGVKISEGEFVLQLIHIFYYYFVARIE